jgi:hypothetical protein
MAAISCSNMPEDKPVTDAATEDASSSPESPVEAKAETTSLAKGEPMEIHTPDKPIHSKKEFMFHMFTVVLGILIALALDGIVTWAHHRVLVREARENIAAEIRKNKATIDGALPEMSKRQAELRHTIDVMHQLEMNRAAVKSATLNFNVANHDLYSTAWQTAATSGAVTYMSYDELRRYTEVYTTQQLFSSLQEQAINRTIDMGALIQTTMYGDLKKVTNERFTAIEQQAYREIIVEKALEGISGELSKGYGDLLKSR